MRTPHTLTGVLALVVAATVSAQNPMIDRATAIELGSGGAAGNVQTALNVKAFGARGDGIMDDTAEIQAAIDAAAARPHGATVFLPRGVYRTGDPLRLASGVVLRGEGPGSVIKPLDSGVHHVIVGDDLEGAGVAALAIDGNATVSNPVSGQGGIVLTGARRCTIDGVHIRDLGKNDVEFAGIHILLNAWEPADTPSPPATAGVPAVGNVIRNCVLDDSNGIASFGIRLKTNWLYPVPDDAFTVGVTHNVVADNHLVGFRWNAIEIAGNATRYNSISGNTVVDCLGLTAVEADKGARDNVFASNRVSGFQDTGSGAVAAMRCQGYDDGNPSVVRIARGNAFIGNVVDDLGNAPSTSSAFLFRSARDNVLSGNVLNARIDTGQSIGVHILDDVAGVTIAGNTIRHAWYGILFVGTAVRLPRLGDLAIRGNQVEASYAGILLSSGGGSELFDALVSDNVVRGVEGGSIQNVGIWLGGNTRGGLIADNLVRDGNEGIRVSGDRITVSGNVVSNVSADGIRVQSIADQTRLIGNVVSGCGIWCLHNEAGDAAVHLDGNVLEGEPGRGPTILRAAAPPVTGTYGRGDIVYNTSPQPGGFVGWICVTSSPAVEWRPFGRIE